MLTHFFEEAELSAVEIQELKRHPRREGEGPVNPILQHLAEMMGWAGRTSVQACLLIALILTVQAALGDRLVPRWRYALWMLLLLRLGMPWLPESSISAYNLFPSAGPRALAAATPRAGQSAGRSSLPASAASSAGAMPGGNSTVSAGADRQPGTAPAPSMVHASQAAATRFSLRRFVAPLLSLWLPLAWLAGWSWSWAVPLARALRWPRQSDATVL